MYPHLLGLKSEMLTQIEARLDRGGVFMYAIIETGGKQYKVSEGDVIFVEKLANEVGDAISFEKILAVSDNGALKLGTPILSGAKVDAKVLSHGKEKKILIFKYKPKKGYSKKQGHRQPYTKVQIEKIKA